MTSEEHAEPWIDLADIEFTRDQLRKRDVSYDGDYVPNMSRLLAAHTDIGPHFSQLYDQVMKRPGQLSPREREMIATVTAAAQDCFY